MDETVRASVQEAAPSRVRPARRRRTPFVDAPDRAAALPTDPLFANQWHLVNTVNIRGRPQRRGGVDGGYYRKTRA